MLPSTMLQIVLCQTPGQNCFTNQYYDLQLIWRCVEEETSQLPAQICIYKLKGSSVDITRALNIERGEEFARATQSDLLCNFSINIRFELL